MAKTKTVSSSELDAYRQCQLKHQLAFKEWWAPPTTSPALEKGSLFHAVVEAHFKAIQWYAQENYPKTRRIPVTESSTVAKIVVSNIMDKTELLHSEGIQTEIQELVEWMYRGYVELYGADPQWEILGVEEKINAMMPTPQGTRSSFRLQGQIDLVVRDFEMGGGIWLSDHKTGQNLPKEKDLDFADQFKIYTYLKRRMGVDVRGVIYDAIRSKKLVRDMETKERYDRFPVVSLPAELETVVREAYDHMRDAYRTRVNDAPRSPNDQTCGWRCPFTEACLAGRKGSDMRRFLQDTGFVIDLESDRGSRSPKDDAK